VFRVNRGNRAKELMCGVMSRYVTAELFLTDQTVLLSTKFCNTSSVVYRMIQEEGSIFWEVIVSVIVRKKFIWTCV
jgi:hypothetical protein